MSKVNPHAIGNVEKLDVTNVDIRIISTYDTWLYYKVPSDCADITFYWPLY